MENKEETTKKTAAKKPKAKVSDGSYTASGFTVPKGTEQDTVYVRMQKVHYNQSTGKATNKEFVNKTNVRSWNKLWQAYITNGHTIHEVLHLPKGAIDPRSTMKDIK